MFINNKKFINHILFLTFIQKTIYTKNQIHIFHFYGVASFRNLEIDILNLFPTELNNIYIL